MEMGDLATWVAALATAAAGGFAGWQILMLRQDRKATVQMERDGVAVTWVQAVRPHVADQDGFATWVFEITVHNPGRMPIRNVEVDMDFPRAVRRVHGDKQVDEPTDHLDLGLPVMAGISSKTWRRTLRLLFDESQSLRGITARVSFVDLEGHQHSNRWAADATAD